MLYLGPGTDAPFTVPHGGVTPGGTLNKPLGRVSAARRVKHSETKRGVWRTSAREHSMIGKYAAILTSAAIVSISAPAIAGGFEPIRVEARMEAGNDQAQAKAKYRDRMRGNLLEQRFSVEVEDHKPGSEVSVTLNGAFVGTIFVNDLGTGEIQLRTAAFIDDPDDGNPIDTDFPRIMPGDTVTVGSLTGTFQAR